MYFSIDILLSNATNKSISLESLKPELQTDPNAYRFFTFVGITKPDYFADLISNDLVHDALFFYKITIFYFNER